MKLKGKLVLFAPSIFLGGGTERVLVNLANELSFEWEIIIVVDRVGVQKTYQLDSSIKLKKYSFGYIRFKYSNNIFVKSINKLFGTVFLRSFFKSHIFKNTNLIISFSPAITNDCFKISFKDKLISFEHWPFSAYSKFPKVQNTIKKNFPLLKKVVVLTEHEKKVYESLGCNVLVIPNVYSFFPEEPAKLENKIVLTIGHFNEQKRRDLLIDCWFLVNKVHPDWNLHIVGDGHLKPEVMRQIINLGLQDSVKIIDPTYEILTHYLSASIFVLSSEFEALPLVLIEAKAVGLPCVSFDIVSGPVEIINNNQDGYIVDFPNVQEMAEKINVLIEDKNLRTEFGTAGRQDVKKRFNPNSIYTKWRDFLKQETN